MTSTVVLSYNCYSGPTKVAVYSSLIVAISPQETALFFFGLFTYRCIAVDNEEVLDDLLEQVSSGITLVSSELLVTMLALFLLRTLIYN